MWDNRVPFETLLGKTITAIDGKEQDVEMSFITNEGERFKLYHEQDCCESCYIADIVGDLEDILNSPILLAEEVTSDKDPEGYIADTSYRDDSFTWTFYKLSTIKGSVTIRWLGESNGYYSESVDFIKI